MNRRAIPKETVELPERRAPEGARGAIERRTIRSRRAARRSPRSRQVPNCPKPPGRPTEARGSLQPNGTKPSVAAHRAAATAEPATK